MRNSMIMSQRIEITPSSQIGLKLIDQLDHAKFRVLVNHLCSTLQLVDRDKLFSQEEEKRLLLSLEVNKDTLIDFLMTIELILLRAAYGVMKPMTIKTLMEQYFPLSEGKVSILMDAWTTHAKGITECLRHKSLFPDQVDEISWELKIQSASSAVLPIVLPVVWLQLGLTGPKEGSTLMVEMDQNDLTDIYDRFETIQRQVDLLEWVPGKNSF